MSGIRGRTSWLESCAEGVCSRRTPRRWPYPGGVDDVWAGVLWAILPTLVVSAAFFFILRGVIRMDRTERKAYARIEAEERAKRGLPASDGTAL